MGKITSEVDWVLQHGVYMLQQIFASGQGQPDEWPEH